jgi:hypothetical protein
MADRGVAMPTKLVDDEPGIEPVELMQAGDPNESEIAELAYSYWEARGGQGGSPWDDWFRAERELKRRQEL